MSLLKVTNLSHCFDEKVLYKDACFELFKNEHIGVVGQNGVGKSTLIKILLGDIVPDNGLIKWSSNIKIGHLTQYAEIDKNITIIKYLHTAFDLLYEIENKLQRLYENSSSLSDETQLLKISTYQDYLATNDFYSIDSKINKVINGLGLNSIGIEKYISELSGGQRTKVIMAKLLLSDYDILLLDEPTNFLDKEHVEWLTNYLAKFEGAFIVISHDFDFLENITTNILDIEFGTIKKYTGKYSEFINQKTHLRHEYVRQYQSQQRKIERTEEYIRKNKAGVNSKIAKGRQKQLDRLERIAPPTFIQKPFIKFKEAQIYPQKMLTVSNLEIGYYYPLLPKLNFSIQGGQKVVITGFNGIGKSTLLKTLVSIIPPISGTFKFSETAKVGYYEQDLNWEDSVKTPLQIIMDDYPNLTIKEARRFLAQCGVKEEHVLREISSLSGGEQSKVKLCKTIITPYNFLILDEPTNHLDLETKEELKKAIIQFKGSVILVSHEEKFYSDLADKVLNIESYYMY